ncbi:SDR family NAD(P)-dependent oxidoreductase [Cellulomonas carbonis]|uniref:3-oxoacyl-ACP reductase n=1 Tax=Cellulomonas carbonis T26 TaxID=947969 RepID=A0A0A0BV45_9CELL|nr:SDR family NAD(P)-dependent oxidoreductase [Cellulomonas carbonis]KGM11044.1 3-oxoacyl-ACP reductase [Cellulomonas carbonis T26]GGB99513.1 short-chain dehydrogenase [Cellulomonas carbonis]
MHDHHDHHDQRAGRDHAPRVVVVTGASSGIGRATAHAFAERGDTVVLAARSAGTLEDVARECVERGGRVTVVPTDVTDAGAVTALVRRAVADHGRVDVWVNAAAVWSYGRFEDTPDEVFRRVLDTTLLGQVHAARAVLPVLRAQGRGVIVNVASVYGLVSAPYVSAYVAAKWGLVGFTEVLRHELRDLPDVHVCAVLPGTVDTPIYRHAANVVGRRIRPLPPVVAPERVAAAVVRVAGRPRARTVVGRAQHVAVWVHALTPGLYERVAGPLVDRLTLLDEPVAPTTGTVERPDPGSNAVRDGWRSRDAARVGAGLAVVGGAVAGAAAVVLRRVVDRRG